MDELSIDLYEDKTAYAPREIVRGAIRWNLQTNPEHLKFSLIWYTSGKGTRDVRVVETVTFDDPGSVGSKDFAFPLPDGPYSFSGKLISLIWAIELTSVPGAQTVRREIVVSPTGSEVLLSEVSTQDGHAWNERPLGRSPLERILGTRR